MRKIFARASNRHAPSMHKPRRRNVVAHGRVNQKRSRTQKLCIWKKIYAYPPWHEKNAKGRKKNIKFRLSKFKSDVMILNITSISNPQSGWQVVWAHAGPTTQIISNINFELFFKEIFFFQMNYIYQKITFIIQNILNLFLSDKNVFNILKTNRA